MNILEEITLKTKIRIAEAQKVLPLNELRRQTEHLISQRASSPLPSFYNALNKPGLSFICEIKKASPSKGVIAKDFFYLSIAEEYEEAGADAISCLTEPFWFQGSDRYLSEIVSSVSIPVLRKDFTISPYMIYQSRLLGASAILLICAILDDTELKDYLSLANELGLDALVEVHDETEVLRALAAGSAIIGVNNRNLKTFQVNIENSLRLRQLIPPSILFVSESGMKTFDDMQKLNENGTDAVLIGEALMRSRDKKAVLRSLRPEGRKGNYDKN